MLPLSATITSPPIPCSWKEVVVKATLCKMTEVLTTLSPDGGSRRPYLVDDIDVANLRELVAQRLCNFDKHEIVNQGW